METKIIELKSHPNFERSKEILSYQKSDSDEEITIRRKGHQSEVEITASVEKIESLTNFLRSRNLI